MDKRFSEASDNGEIAVLKYEDIDNAFGGIVDGLLG